MKKVFLFFILLGIAQSSFAGFKTKPSQIWIFGDSFSDTGNQRVVLSGFGIDFPPDPPYFDGRISNGPMWVEGVAAEFGLTARASQLFDPTMPEVAATNFSQAGSVTDSTQVPVAVFGVLPGIRQQVDFFINNVAPFVDTTNNLFVVFGGANDSVLVCYVNAEGQPVNPPLCDPFNPPATASRDQAIISVNNISKMIRDLYAAGARDFLVPNYPGSVLPEPAQFTPNPIPLLATQFAAFFNTALAIELRNIRRELLHIKITEFDSFKFFRKVLLNPEKFGITNVSEPCVTYVPSFFTPEIISVCDNPEEYFYFDSLHPTSTVHALWAEKVIRKLQPKHKNRKIWEILKNWHKWKEWKEWKNRQKGW